MAQYNLGFTNQRVGNNSEYRSADILPTSLSTMGFGQVGRAVGSGSTQGGMTLSQLLAMQREANAQQKQENIATREATLGVIGGVPTAFMGDPLWQSTRQSAQSLVDNPEAINDQTQQLIQNRAANMTNAAANTSLEGMRRQLAAQGLLGSSVEQGAMGQLERDRMAALADASTKLEIERAARRNQDILASQNMGAALAGQQSGVNERMAALRAQSDVYFNPEDLSGYGALFAGMNQNVGGGGGGVSRQKSVLPQGADVFGGVTGLNQFGGLSPGQTGIQTPYYWNQYLQSTGALGPGQVDARYWDTPGWDNLASGNNDWTGSSSYPTTSYGDTDKIVFR